MGTLKRTRRRVVEEGINWGIYVWQMPDNNILGDKDGNVLNVPAIRGDIRAMNAIRRFVEQELKIHSGTPVFLEGAQPLTDIEHDDQMDQLMNGYVPSLDVASHIDDAKRKKRNGGN